MRWGKIIFITALAYFITTKSKAQTFYANTKDSIRLVDIASCTAEITPFACKPDFFSMTLVHDTLYFITVNDGLYRTFLKYPSKCEKVMDIRPLNSLTADKNGMLYGAMANSFIKIDVRTKTIQEYFMPHPAAGDMIFYKDKLYVAASPGLIVEVNIEEPLDSKVYMDLGRGGIYGLISVEGGCNKNKVYALAANGVTTQLIELDMENKANLGVKCEVQGTYHDAASTTETGTVRGLTISQLDVKDVCLTSAIPSSITIAASGTASQLTYHLNNTWSNTTGKFENLPQGNYAVHITSPEGCAADTTVTVDELFCEAKMPSAFTPNGDHVNDVFRPLGLKPSENAILCVYNVWGEKIFQTADIIHGWDGTINNIPQASGTYIWTFSYSNANNKTEFLRGTVLLLR